MQDERWLRAAALNSFVRERGRDKLRTFSQGLGQRESMRPCRAAAPRDEGLGEVLWACGYGR